MSAKVFFGCMPPSLLLFERFVCTSTHGLERSLDEIFLIPFQHKHTSACFEENICTIVKYIMNCMAELQDGALDQPGCARSYGLLGPESSRTSDRRTICEEILSTIKYK